ncbi:MAG: hypothetical protein E7090_08630 [Bacteroidales bacterium]|nr:hypothetical protein [Bacteroidales bacterium]
MASIFDYQFNAGGNFTAAMDGMAESTGRFNAAVETRQKACQSGNRSLPYLASDYIDRTSRAF